jgi:hypothetical protein
MFPMSFQYLALVARCCVQSPWGGLICRRRTLYFLLYVIFLFLSDLVYVRSAYITCDRSLSININTVLTFVLNQVHYRYLKVVGNEKRGGSGSKLLIEYGFGPWRSMSV